MPKGERLEIKRRQRHVFRWVRPLSVSLLVLAGLFVLGNIGVGFWYRNRVLPNYSVGSVEVGGVQFDQLDERVAASALLSTRVTLAKDDNKIEITPQELGVEVDWRNTRERLVDARSWVPLATLFMHRTVPVELKIDNAQFAAATKILEARFTKAPLPERIVFEQTNFAVAAPEPGYHLATSQLRADVMAALEYGKTVIAVPTTSVHANDPTGKLGGELERLQQTLAVNITLTGAGRSQQLGPADIGRMYQPAGQTMQPSATRAAEVIADVAKTLGLQPVNQQDAAAATLYAVHKARAITFQLADQSAKMRHYCTAVKGEVSDAALPEFRQKLAAVYGDPRGWGQGGVALVHAESGCDFTAWLSAPGAMTSFGAICDSYYSCRVGPNVVINYDRWMGATDPWNAAGGNLEDYRVMVINHETGHWLGFGHLNCPGPGHPAPVMQQQSISLQGCTFNPWPVASETTALKQKLGT